MNRFKGVFTALITPFKDGAVDWKSLKSLVDQQIQGGIQGFVINGTTAESPTLKKTERDEVFRRVRDWTGGAVPLIMGTGSNSTEATIEATKEAAAIGADAALVVVPYYNKPPQRGLVAHFKAVAESSKIPIILYNVPGRTITAMTLETIQELSKVPGIIGIKEASGKIDFARDISKACGPDFVLLSGDDGTYADFLEAGGHGVISVATHILPKEFVGWTKAARDRDFTTGKSGIQKTLKLIDLLFSEANPIPVKKALQMMKVIDSAELRLPLVELEESRWPELHQEMKTNGLVK